MPILSFLPRQIAHQPKHAPIAPRARKPAAGRGPGCATEVLEAGSISLPKPMHAQRAASDTLPWSIVRKRTILS